MIKQVPFLFLLLLTTSLLQAQNKGKKRFQLPMEINEVSGLYRASTDSLWWHNDSGDGPNIFLTNGKGETTRKKNIISCTGH